MFELQASMQVAYAMGILTGIVFTVIVIVACQLAAIGKAGDYAQ